MSEFVIFLTLGLLWWKLKIFIDNFSHVSPNRFWRIFSMLLNTAIQQLNGFEKYSIAISLMLNHNLTGLFMYYSLEQKSGTLLWPGPLSPIRGHRPCILVGTKREYQECGQILEKPRYTGYKVPLTKNSLRALLVTRNKGFVREFR